jgi:DNA-binding transcriptional regulator PaaX
MQPKTEDFLNLLLWTTSLLLRPTFRNLTDSYESWAYRNGLLREVSTLERKQLVERDAAVPDDRIYRLTWRGRLHALGGRDPQTHWSREWDGRWRLVIFDIPENQGSHRDRLRHYLRDKHFGCLQKSVWITPDPLEEERKTLIGGKINVESLILLEARPCAGESDTEIAAGAWDFERINQRYTNHSRILEQFPGRSLHNEASAKVLLRWASEERVAWLAAVTSDPLLPERILPSGYLGQQAWRRRIEMLRQASKLVRAFKP